ncbi:hypothetical protein SAMN07250955_10632 [Arboricoccus pini]|uniref:Uncharacterized protein n=1 Tax=Arboricoccus pini TaxID=1963835 RepID=A0A212R6U0_9PROT|nr:hypothetical protein SAMN07250955_10632 [Arboricoccus pini]
MPGDVRLGSVDELSTVALNRLSALARDIADQAARPVATASRRSRQS